MFILYRKKTKAMRTSAAARFASRETPRARFGARGPDRGRWSGHSAARSSLAMTMRWIWLVPSKICGTLASRMYRSTGKSLV